MNSLKKILLSTGVLLILNFFGLVGVLNDGFIRLKQLVTPEAEQWVSEIDGKTRGIILSSATIKDKKPLSIKFGRDSDIKISRGDLLLGRDKICLTDFISFSKKDCLIQFESDENNHLLVSGKFYDTQQCLMVTVDRNLFILSPECTFTYNKDKYGFEIVDRDFNVVLSIDSVDDNTIIIEGAFITESNYVIVSNDMLASYLSDEVDLEVFQHNKENVKPLFEYREKDWFGKRIKN